MFFYVWSVVVLFGGVLTASSFEGFVVEAQSEVFDHQCVVWSQPKFIVEGGGTLCCQEARYDQERGILEGVGATWINLFPGTLSCLDESIQMTCDKVVVVVDRHWVHHPLNTAVSDIQADGVEVEVGPLRFRGDHFAYHRKRGDADLIPSICREEGLSEEELVQWSGHVSVCWEGAGCLETEDLEIEYCPFFGQFVDLLCRGTTYISDEEGQKICSPQPLELALFDFSEELEFKSREGKRGDGLSPPLASQDRVAMRTRWGYVSGNTFCLYLNRKEGVCVTSIRGCVRVDIHSRIPWKEGQIGLAEGAMVQAKQVEFCMAPILLFDPDKGRILEAKDSLLIDLHSKTFFGSYQEFPLSKRDMAWYQQQMIPPSVRLNDF